MSPTGETAQTSRACAREVAGEAFEVLAELVADLVLERLQVRASTSAPSGPRESWRLLDVDEVAEMLGRSRRWVHGAVKERGLPVIRLDGGALAFDPDDVKAWARARRVPAGEAETLADRWQQGREPASVAASGNGPRSAMQRVGGRG